MKNRRSRRARPRLRADHSLVTRFLANTLDRYVGRVPDPEWCIAYLILLGAEQEGIRTLAPGKGHRLH